jgi:hypothetical protein
MRAGCFQVETSRSLGIESGHIEREQVANPRSEWSSASGTNPFADRLNKNRFPHESLISKQNPPPAEGML